MGTKGSSVKMKESIIFRICSLFKKNKHNKAKKKCVILAHLASVSFSNRRQPKARGDKEKTIMETNTVDV